MTLLDLYRKVKGICGCLNSADVPLKCNGNDFNVDFQVESKDAIVSHIEVKQYLALTWEDIPKLIELTGKTFRTFSDAGRQDVSLQELYEEVLRRFNSQRENK